MTLLTATRCTIVDETMQKYIPIYLVYNICVILIDQDADSLLEGLSPAHMHIVRYVPAWLPGAGFQRDAAVRHKAADKHLHIAYDDFLQRLVRLLFDELVGLWD